MQLTKHTDNSLRVLMYLALKPDEIGTIAEVSEKFHMSRNHLMKVVHRLSGLGYIESIQGRGGGIRLAKPANTMKVGGIVRNMENTLDLIDCESLSCPIMTACRLKGAIDRATNSFLTVLDEYTIADLVKSRTTLLRLVG